MKKVIILIVLILNILIFTGCTSFYTLKPNYDINTKNLNIDGYVLKNAVETIGKNNRDINAVGWEYKKFVTDDNICKKLAYSYSDISNTNRYYFISAIDDVKSDYEGKCDIEKINNLNFYICQVDIQTIKNKETTNETVYRYGITSSVVKDSGYGIKTKVYLGSKANCFVKIRDYFLNKSTSKNIQ